MYQNELEAIKKAGRFRARMLYPTQLIDFASNDYLGFANDATQLQKAYDLMQSYNTYAPKASMLVNGYHPIHQYFEEKLCELNRFESAIVVGSGFLANISLIEALVRKKDRLFMDEEYHASGILASKLLDTSQVVLFKHNDADDLQKKIAQHKSSSRNIIAIEGVYSMRGDIAPKAIFDVANKHEALLIVDEAHSSGVIGDNLLGIFDYYKLPIQSNYIKMGTLGKAYGSYGAYILASKHIVSFLENRAKPIIYSTAPSLFDTALALVNLKKLYTQKEKFITKIQKRQKLVQKILGITLEALILPIPQNSNQQAMHNKELLIQKGYLIGAIRQPTVEKPILRVIPRLGESKKELKSMLECIASFDSHWEEEYGIEND